MRKTAALVFFSLVLCGVVPAAPNIFSGYAFSLKTDTGFLYGQGEEGAGFPGSGSKMALLTWDMKPLFYLGMALDFSRTRPLEKAGFFGSFSAKFGIPADTGKMEDKDWNALGLLTDFSRHDNHTESAVLLDLLLGASIPIKSRVILGLYGGFSWMRFSWTGRDGYGYYGNRNPPSTFFTGPVVSYVQEWLLFYPGISLVVPFLSRFALQVSFQGSPLVFCAARDDHIARQIAGSGAEYRDRIRWGLYLEPKAELRFMPRENCTLSLDFAYRLTESGQGTSSYTETGQDRWRSYALPSSATAAVRYFTAGLYFKIGLY
jgi:outer membrane protease